MGLDEKPASTSPDARFSRAHRALRTAAVTGTNGKTTTTSMIAAIVGAKGEPRAWLTTLGAWVDGEPVVADDPTHEFLLTVERAAARGVRTLALEVTSKALAQGLARRWPPHIAVFTNLTRDHLDMHRSAEAYLAAKAQLFLALPPGGVAVLNSDDPASALIEEVLPPGRTVRGFAVRGKSPDPRARLARAENLSSWLIAGAVHTSAHGTRVDLEPSPLADALGGELDLAVVGAVHAENALAAALAADALGYPGEVIRRGLEAYRGVAGRFEIIATRPLVVVDYAHTPDGLDGTLRTARALVPDSGRLCCVFGCGGDRDRGKRPEMGAIADRLADVVVLTADNPRFEAPEAIAADVRGGVPAPRAIWQEELDRRQAITRAIALASDDDVVIIAGKGHEEEQEIRGQRTPFSDAAVAREALGARHAR